MLNLMFGSFRSQVKIPVLAALIAMFWSGPVSADDEMSNRAHIAAGPYGQCYAKSVPANIYDPDDQPRQMGFTDIYRVKAEGDILLRRYNWFAQQIYLNCLAGSEPVVMRVGPWHRGHDPHEGHLALAFYQNGKVLKSYSTLDISGPELSQDPSFSKYKNVSASVSHYTVFQHGLEYVKTTQRKGSVFTEGWVVKGVTIDGRTLVFNSKTGDLY